MYKAFRCMSRHLKEELTGRLLEKLSLGENEELNLFNSMILSPYILYSPVFMDPGCKKRYLNRIFILIP